MCDDAAQVSERWAKDEKEEGGGMGITPRLPFLYLILFIPSMTRKLQFLDNICRIYLVK